MSRQAVAFTIAIVGYLVPPATLALELSLGWLSGHGDGFPTLLLSILAMIGLCALATQIARPQSDASAETAASLRLARQVAMVGAVGPAALLALGLSMLVVSGSGQ